ncbi:MAG: hypothetical protein L6R37_006766 [Teloschistes peruensis]|nr:MAG: hypothetical protein L6R37_006766 [Teloschistes peruensis]
MSCGEPREPRDAQNSTRYQNIECIESLLSIIKSSIDAMSSLTADLLQKIKEHGDAIQRGEATVDREPRTEFSDLGRALTGSLKPFNIASVESKYGAIEKGVATTFNSAQAALVSENYTHCLSLYRQIQGNLSNASHDTEAPVKKEELQSWKATVQYKVSIMVMMLMPLADASQRLASIENDVVQNVSLASVYSLVFDEGLPAAVKEPRLFDDLVKEE